MGGGGKKKPAPKPKPAPAPPPGPDWAAIFREQNAAQERMAQAQREEQARLRAEEEARRQAEEARRQQEKWDMEQKARDKDAMASFEANQQAGAKQQAGIGLPSQKQAIVDSLAPGLAGTSTPPPAVTGEKGNEYYAPQKKIGGQ
jgi:hypothetical protein